ncbi:hypothetical protein [Nonomuraea sp. 10N515B]|uniref:hypothetical protein n=1 Tax=Nonomuraea sp. 10N515B TaxID=3457422 RepID=UPI003FCE9FF9
MACRRRRPSWTSPRAIRRNTARYLEGGQVTGVLGWNMPKQARLLRQQELGSRQTTQPFAPA